MFEIDLNQLLNTLIAGGLLYSGIRIELKYLWRDVTKMGERIERLELNK